MFTQPCLLRNARKELAINVMKLGYEPEYMLWRNNIEGSNLVLEYQHWHYTDSDNKPHCIDCGENEELFLAIAALRDDSDYMQWFTDESLWYLCDGSRFDGYCAYNDISFDESKMHKATVDELIKHFNK
jgi:hypothetical protein